MIIEHPSNIDSTLFIRQISCSVLAHAASRYVRSREYLVQKGALEAKGETTISQA